MPEFPIKIKIVREKRKKEINLIHYKSKAAKQFNQNLAFIFSLLFTICAIAILSLTDEQIHTTTIQEYFNFIFPIKNVQRFQYIFGSVLFIFLSISFLWIWISNTQR
jgi:hypothetical protein